MWIGRLFSCCVASFLLILASVAGSVFVYKCVCLARPSSVCSILQLAVYILRVLGEHDDGNYVP